MWWQTILGWNGGGWAAWAMVLGNFKCWGVLPIWVYSRHVLATGTGWDCLHIFTLSSTILSFLFSLISLRDRSLTWLQCCWLSCKTLNEPPHDKTNKMNLRPAKTQIWTSAPSDQSLRCPHEESLGSLATNWTHSKDPDQTGRMPKLIRVFGGRTCHFADFVMRGLKSNIIKIFYSFSYQTNACKVAQPKILFHDF